MTRLLFIKLIRDLRTIWPRILLMIVAMSLTLAMFSGISYTWGITGRETLRSYSSTNPASATILFERGLDADKMAAIAKEAGKQPGIIDAAPRAQHKLQIFQEGGRWEPNPLQIFVSAPDDPMRIETFKIEQGNWPPAAGEVLIERSSFGLLKLKVGDTVVVQAPNGKPTSLRVSGVVYYPALVPSFQEQKGYGFISTASLPDLGEPILLDELKIHVADQPGIAIPSRDRDVIVATARDLAGWLQRTYGVVIREIQVPMPYAHPHQRQTNILLLSLLVFGGAGLLLSAVLVATMLNGLFAQQIPQIGIMKAIGARSSQVLQLYLLMTLVIAVAATALAIVPGIWISRAFAAAVLGVLAIDAASLAAPWWMYVVVVAAGVGVPVLFALGPLLKAKRTTVLEALNDRGVDPRAFAANRLDSWLGKLRGLNRMLLMAFRNIFRRRARFLLSVGLLACAGTVFVAGMSTMSSVQASLDRSRESRKWDVEVEFDNADRASADTLKNLMTQIPRLTGVEAWTIVQTSIAQPGQFSVSRTYPDQGHSSMNLDAIPSGSSLIPPQMFEGRWLRPGETGAVVIGQKVPAEVLPGLRSGDTVQLSIGGRPTSWNVVGISEYAHGSVSAWVTAEGFEAATGANPPNVLRVFTDRHDEETRAAVANAAERALAEASIRVKSSASVSRSEAASEGHFLPIILIFLGLSIAMGVVGCVGLASTMSTNVLERAREFGVMHAIGARASTVRRIVVAEGVFVAVTSCVVAAIPALLLAAVMTAGLGRLFLYQALPFRASGSAIVIWAVVVVIGAALATLAPAYRASRMTVREALMYQ
ncbi:FtsX-like permease family protein [Mesorhizobium sp.]|uniref:FtsX-like permease family protein n=1 Tax=Mesorhizobium sp. TaxID=1871066 RepID=UPI000FE8EE5F|nr:FtsX-like permease family protein [Mesorhizobium sp.]RWI36102.1 MAG: ABC transporter permease [Mesorhizobium sp.]